MKNYYLNPSTRDLIVHDTEKDEVIIVQAIKTVKVWIGGEITMGDFGGKNHGEVVEDADKRGGYTNHNFNPKTGKRRKKGERTRICKKCGQPGHMQKTCPN